MDQFLQPRVGRWIDTSRMEAALGVCPGQPDRERGICKQRAHIHCIATAAACCRAVVSVCLHPWMGRLPCPQNRGCLTHPASAWLLAGAATGAALDGREGGGKGGGGRLGGDEGRLNLRDSRLARRTSIISEKSRLSKDGPARLASAPQKTVKAMICGKRSRRCPKKYHAAHSKHPACLCSCLCSYVSSNPV